MPQMLMTLGIGLLLSLAARAETSDMNQIRQKGIASFVPAEPT